MSRRLVREHRLDPYGLRLLVAFGEDGWRALRRRVPPLPKAPPPMAGGATHLVTWSSADGTDHKAYIVVWCDPQSHPTEASWVQTVAHEAHHAAGLVMELIGHDGYGIDEPAAYLAGFIAQFCYEARPEG